MTADGDGAGHRGFPGGGRRDDGGGAVGAARQRGDRRVGASARAAALTSDERRELEQRLDLFEACDLSVPVPARLLRRLIADEVS